MSLTCVLSGPAGGRSPLLSVLQRAGANVNEQPDTNPHHGLPTSESLGWITARVEELATVEQALARTPDWGLRLHWNTPSCRACNGHGIGVGGSTCLHCLGAGYSEREYQPPDRVAALEARIAELEGKVV